MFVGTGVFVDAGGGVNVGGGVEVCGIVGVASSVPAKPDENTNTVKRSKTRMAIPPINAGSGIAILPNLRPAGVSVFCSIPTGWIVGGGFDSGSASGTGSGSRVGAVATIGEEIGSRAGVCLRFLEDLFFSRVRSAPQTTHFVAAAPTRVPQVGQRRGAGGGAACFFDMQIDWEPQQKSGVICYDY